MNEWILKPMIRYGKVFVLVIEDEVIGIAEYMRNFDGNEIFSIKIFRKNKIKKIGLTVSLENKKAIKLYKKMGFKMEEMLKDEYGKGIDRLYLGKEI
ncbi:MAG: hypothetical protein B6227_02455 [Fusobacteriia bacterium 4572_74]|nr:MAG: hypothetical protein B6227_02455 [Fusobacteriia bacterium 4572_74]